MEDDESSDYDYSESESDNNNHSEEEDEDDSQISEVFRSNFTSTSSLLDEKDALEEEQRRSFFLSSILWIALAFDSVFNTQKRDLLFPSNISNNMELTTALASGFILASAVSFLQSIAWKAPSVTTSSADPHDESMAQLATQRKTNLLLIAFALFHLPAYIHKSSGAPFLGITAAYIVAYNAILAINAYIKSLPKSSSSSSSLSLESVRNILIKDGSSFISSFFQSANREQNNKVKMKSGFIYLIAAIFASLRIVNAFHQIWMLKSVQTIDSMKQIALHWSSLARYVLGGGLALLLKQYDSSSSEKTAVSSSDRRHHGLVFRGLNGILSICSIGVATSLYVTRYILKVGGSGAGSNLWGAGTVFDPLKLLIFGLFAGYQALSTTPCTATS
eukprot:CAMPEP_0185734702 /NCGR_PEP_ID=MMETSP1171-20130828/23183_1 /TAXON_ID=374046 /ORGANISM="Helicotheca tamensis, Strain CCMP826" /LENGTH=389 /DNA_ID=CAMNT_0028404765 /DNA_START=361 /DNA_END=1530 /DNA_ORIENTATION=-